jgi:magnesium-transporting ATPase (P-type)
MKDAKKLFHYISYLQYPLLLVAVFYCYRPFFDTLETLWADLNKGFVFLGLGISFSTLQDTTKTQNKISKRIYENPTYARRFIIAIVIQIIFFISLGMFGLFFSDNTPMQELSFGMIVLAIGIIGMLKAAIEMAEHHRIKN